MIRRLDAWLGREIFHPPIIWICQRAGISQYAFCRYGWWIVAMQAVWLDRRAGFGFILFDCGFAVMRTLSASISPDRPATSAGFLRALLGGLIAFQALSHDPGHWSLLANTLLALTAEYAATIRTIPPRKRRHAKAKEAAYAR